MKDCYRGQFLIAGKSLSDPNFFKTVVLIVEHSDEGAMGLVINRPSSISIHNALSSHFSDFELPEEMVYCGGPVEPSALFIIHDEPKFNGSETPVIPDVFVANSAETFDRVVRHAADAPHMLRFRIFFGCAGWAPDQLEGEVERGDWLIHPASESLIFEDDPYNIWDDALTEAYTAHRILPFMPKNPEWN